MILDPLYILFALPGLLIGLIAQVLLKFAYGIYSKRSAGTNITGMEAAQILNDKEGFGVDFQVTPGQLNDYFDPTRHIVNLSQDNSVNSSIANIAVVAHEFGHVQQKESGNALFKIRGLLVPAVNFGSGIGFILIMIGLGIGAAASGLTWIGIALFSLTTIFSVVTFPIEVDASLRGLKLIRKHGLIAEGNMGGAKWVLAAAAMTYFAALVQSLGQLVYFVLLAQSGGRRD